MKLVRVTETWQQALVFDIRKQTFVLGQNIPIKLEFDEKYGGIYDYILLEDAREGIATARVNVTTANQGYGKIERVAVLPNYQRKGYGTSVIQASEQWLVEKGIKKSVITSQVKAAAFYERLGYVIEPTKESVSEIPTVYMTKRL